MIVKTKKQDTQVAAQHRDTCSFFLFSLFLAFAVQRVYSNHLNAVMGKVIGVSVECQTNELCANDRSGDGESQMTV